MAKMIGLMLMVGMIWVCVEVYNEGPDRAFGGAFAFLNAGDDLPERAVERISTPKRVRTKVTALVEDGAKRYEKFEPEF